jgi:hypothetical protein
MAKSVAAGVVLVWLGWAGLGGAQAQSMPQQPGVIDLAPVVVSGVQPGPGLWQVTAPDGHTLWLLGTVSPLPARLDWRADEVKAVIASADAVLGAPGWNLDADVGFFRGLTLLPAAMKAALDPEGRRLDEILPPEVVEHQLPMLVDRANAWAVGDIEALQQLALKSQYDACVGAIAGSELGRRRGLSDLEARSAEKWLAAARDALARYPVTFATVPVHALVAPSGYLEHLRQAGYTVQAP